LRHGPEAPEGEPDNSDPSRSRRLLLYAALFELGLGVVALLLGALVGINPAQRLELSLPGTLLGLAATLPLVLLFLLFLRGDLPSLKRIRQLLFGLLRPVAPALSLPMALLLGGAAGVGEELLFRGLLQEGLSTLLGAIPGLLLASLIFGLLHAVTPVYAVFATFLGVVLGALFLYSASLLPSLLAHALYDAAGLIMLRRELRKR
jgi:hypothetical protein